MNRRGFLQAVLAWSTGGAALVKLATAEERGIEWQPLNIGDARDVLQMRKLQVEEIARIFNVPTRLLQTVAVKRSK